MERHVVDALTRLSLDDFEKERGIHIHDRALGGELIDRHRAENNRAAGQDFAANLVEISAGGEIHDGVGSIAHRGVELFDLLAEQLMEIRGAQVGVNLGAEIFADSDRAELVVPIVRNYHLPGGDQRPDLLGSQPFIFGDLDHLAGDVSLTCRFSLGHRSTSAGALRLRQTLILVFTISDAMLFAKRAQLLDHPLGARQMCYRNKVCQRHHQHRGSCPVHVCDHAASVDDTDAVCIRDEQDRQTGDGQRDGRSGHDSLVQLGNGIFATDSPLGSLTPREGTKRMRRSIVCAIAQNSRVLPQTPIFLSRSYRAFRP